MIKKIFYITAISTFSLVNAQKYVGINTYTPQRELHVNGNMRVATLPVPASYATTISYVGYEPSNKELVKYSDYNKKKYFVSTMYFRETSQNIINFLTGYTTATDPATKDNITVYFGEISSSSNSPYYGSSSTPYNNINYTGLFSYHKNSANAYYARAGNVSIDNDANSDYIISYNEANDTHQVKSNFIYRVKLATALDFVPKSIYISPQLSGNYSDNIAASIVSYNSTTNELLLSLSRVDLRLNAWAANHGYNVILME
ncbi:hypothetical protein [Chryseobacterium sp.]|uniref:hypothetical protein n=1 Tax=Chryseobacterium sp. TaxID=1871047 RepID=UPI00388EA33C